MGIRITKDLKESILRAVLGNRADEVRTMLDNCPELLYEEYSLPRSRNSGTIYTYFVIQNGKTAAVNTKQTGDNAFDTYLLDSDKPRRLINFCYLPCCRETAEVLIEKGMHPDSQIPSPLKFILNRNPKHEKETALSNLVKYMVDVWHYYNYYKSDKKEAESCWIILKELKEYFCFLVDQGADPFISVDYSWAWHFDNNTPYITVFKGLLSCASPSSDKDREAEWATLLEEMLMKCLDVLPSQGSKNDITQRELFAFGYTEDPLQEMFSTLCSLISDGDSRKKNLGDSRKKTLSQMILRVMEAYCRKRNNPEEIRRTAIRYGWHDTLAKPNFEKQAPLESESFAVWKLAEDFVSKYLPLGESKYQSLPFKVLITGDALGIGSLRMTPQIVRYYLENGIAPETKDTDDNNLWHYLAVYLLNLYKVLEDPTEKIRLRQEAIELLTEKYPDGVNEKNRDGDTPILMFCRVFGDYLVQGNKNGELNNRRTEIAEYIWETIENMSEIGADPAVCDRTGKSLERLLPGAIRKILAQKRLESSVIETDLELFVER